MPVEQEKEEEPLANPLHEAQGLMVQARCLLLQAVEQRVRLPWLVGE